MFKRIIFIVALVFSTVMLAQNYVKHTVLEGEIEEGKRYTEAESLIRKAIVLAPDDAPVMDSMGWILFRTGKAEEAEAWLRKAYEHLPDPEIAGHLVEVLLARGKADDAKRLLKDTLAKFPDDPLLTKLKDKLVGL